MMVLFDFLSKCIAPLQQCLCPAWLYTKENDTTWLEPSRGPDLDSKALETLLSKLSSVDFVNPPVACALILLD
jgi:hypothetical protein